MILSKTLAGDEVRYFRKSIIVFFRGKRKVLSTGPINGGYHETLTSIFNHDLNPDEGMPHELKAPTYEEHMVIVAKELGLNPKKTSGLGTAVSMSNVSIRTESYNGLEVMAIVTAGVEMNAGRVGDPASFDERELSTEHEPGTINVILNISANLTPSAVARSLATATEAKTAALQELMVDSRYSNGLATGTGTDGIIVVSNAESDIYLTNAGKHSKLGELTGRAVKDAVKDALYKQSGLGPQYQHSVLKRWRRYGITEETIWQRYCQREKMSTRESFLECLYVLENNITLVTFSSLYLHLLDQLDWSLLSQEEVRKGAELILFKLKEEFDILQGIELPTLGNDFLSAAISSFEKIIVAAIDAEDNK